MSYIISVDTKQVIAHTSEKLQSGQQVSISETRVQESINQSRAFNLVNGTRGVVSNDKKWNNTVYLSASDVNSRQSDDYYFDI